MENVEEYVDALTDDQTGKIYEFYDSGGYDHLMVFTHTEMPRKDIFLRRKILIEYLFDSIQIKIYYEVNGISNEEYDNSDDVKEFLNVLHPDTIFKDFLHHIRKHRFSEPLFHRLNQNVRSPVLKLIGGFVATGGLRSNKITKDNILEIRNLLKETFYNKDHQCVTANDIMNNNKKRKEIMDIIEIISQFIS